jgi:hypothetical protein
MPAGKTIKTIRRSKRSPDEAKRNPGFMSVTAPPPHFAALHAGYELIEA